jgi:hypothetical protein
MNRHVGATICRTTNPTFPPNRITQDSPVALQQPNQPEKTEPKTMNRQTHHGRLVGVGDVSEEVGVRGALLLEQLPEEQPPARGGPRAVRSHHHEARG